MTVSLQHFGDNASYPLLIIDDQYASGKITDLLIQRARIALIAFDVRQHNLENAPFERLAFNFYVSAMTFYDSIAFAQAHAESRDALGREEGLEDPLFDLFGHANAGVAERDVYNRPVCGGIDGDRYCAPNSHRVERVQDHIDEYFTQLGGLSPHQQIFARLQLQFDLILDTE